MKRKKVSQEWWFIIRFILMIPFICAAKIYEKITDIGGEVISYIAIAIYIAFGRED